jgi:hypothetical protein
MKFNFSFGNYFDPGSRAEDNYFRVSLGAGAIRFFRLALEAHGHKVDASMRYVDPNAINIFFEHFRSAEVATELKRRGVRYGLICTEPLDTDDQYNPFEFAPTVARANYESFATAAANAEFVWYLLENAKTACLRLNPNSHFFPYGHVAGYAELRDPARREYVCDFHISGQETERRNGVANELRKRGFVVASSGFEPEFIHNSMLERARATLSIQKSDGHNIFSITRVHHAIMNRAPVLVEYDGPVSYLSPYCTAAAPARFIDACAEFVKRTDLAVHAQTMYDRFAHEMAMAPILSGILRDTFRS